MESALRKEGAAVTSNSTDNNAQPAGIEFESQFIHRQGRQGRRLSHVPVPTSPGEHVILLTCYDRS